MFNFYFAYSGNEPPYKTRWTSQEVLEVIKGHRHIQTNTNGTTLTAESHDCDWVATGAAFFPFKVEPGDLFILLHQDRNHLHYVKEAFEKGAVAALLTLTRPPNSVDASDVSAIFNKEELRKCIFVENSNDALTSLARHASRSNTDCTKIAITGSVGKTSTKEGLVQILSAITASQNKHVYWNYLNENNEPGLGLYLIKMPRNGLIDYCVFELGMSNPNEIRTLVHMIQPSIVMILNIAEAHLGSFRCIEEILDAKCEIFETNLDEDEYDGSSRNVTAILNRDDKYFSRMLHHAGRNQISRLVTYGEHTESTFQLVKYEMDSEGTHATMRYRKEEYDFYIGQPGKAWVCNSLAIIAAVECLLPSAVPEALKELRNVRSVSGRGVVHTVALPSGPGQFMLIDETYNASPSSMKCSLERLGLVPDNEGGRGRRRIAVLGDMLGLGAEKELEYHLDLRPVIVSSNIDLVFVCGPLMNRLYKTLDESMRGGAVDNDPRELVHRLKDVVQNGDVVSVKGSRTMNMELIVQAFVDKL